MRVTAPARSDQINADDFIAGPATFTIAGVKKGKAEAPYDIALVETPGKVWRPPLTVLRLLIAAWGDEADVWVGRRVVLYRDAAVRMSGEEVGGIRVSHMSDLPGGKTFKERVSSSRGKKVTVTAEPLTDAAPASPAPDTASRASKAVEWFAAKGVVQSVLEAHVGKPIAEWDDADLAALKTDSDVLVGDES